MIFRVLDHRPIASLPRESLDFQMVDDVVNSGDVGKNVPKDLPLAFAGERAFEIDDSFARQDRKLVHIDLAVLANEIFEVLAQLIVIEAL